MYVLTSCQMLHLRNNCLLNSIGVHMCARGLSRMPCSASGACCCAWQAERLARTHGDLLQSKRFHDAVVFFLTDLYGPNDLSPHIEDLRRLVPLMARTLPEAGVKAVAHAIELNALAEDLDGAMVEALDAQAAKISNPAYAAAYRKVGRAEVRERQIDLIALLGGALEALARQRFVGTALWAIRKPAQAAGFGDLQGFIERG